MNDHLTPAGRRGLGNIDNLHLPNSPSDRSKHVNNLEDLVNWLKPATEEHPDGFGGGLLLVLSATPTARRP
jgi:hypothetical protein